MKKIIAAAVLGSITLVGSGVAFADGEPLPGRRPPCSIIRKSPAEQGLGTALCEHPASNPLH